MQYFSDLREIKSHWCFVQSFEIELLEKSLKYNGVISVIGFFRPICEQDVLFVTVSVQLQLTPHRMKFQIQTSGRVCHLAIYFVSLLFIYIAKIKCSQQAKEAICMCMSAWLFVLCQQASSQASSIIMQLGNNLLQLFTQ